MDKKDLILEIKDLSIDYKTDRGDIRACDNINLNIYRGEIVGIIGESGSGKSTLANGILQMLQSPGVISEGQVFYYPKSGEKVELSGLSKSEYIKYRWTNITTVFQAAQNALNPTLRIKEHFIETVKAHDKKATEEEILKTTKEIFKKVRLEERVLDSYPHQLSGGMKQRTIIALSILLEPDILFLDEPTTALDVITQWYILEILKDIHKETNITMIFLTHDVSIIGSIVNKLGVMYAGQLVEYGKVEDVFLRPVHAYTEGLMKAVPSLDDDISERKAIPGFPPNLLELQEGCRFGDRCYLAKEGLCDYKAFDWKTMELVGDEQYTLCWKWKQVRENVLN